MKINEFIHDTRIQAFSLIAFLQRDIWKIRLSDLPKRKSFFMRILRMLVVTLTGIKKDEIRLRASALTYFSALSFVPVLALAFGIAKGFGLENLLQKEIMKAFAGQEEVMAYAMQYAESMLDSTQGGTIAGIGLFLLLWSVIKLLTNIENAMNSIWHVHKSRTYLRKFTDYLSMVMIAPVLLISANSATVMIVTTIKDLTEQVEVLSWFSPLVFFLFRLIPFVLFWVLFTVLYIIMPNTKVNTRSAIIAGIVAGTVFQLTQWGYINFQVGVSRYNAIYGSFAALPLFLIWLLISWWIILIGSKLAYAHQNIEQYDVGWNTVNPSLTFKKFLSLMVLQTLAKQFAAGKPPMTNHQIANELKTPLLFVETVLDELQDARLVSEINESDSKQPTYQPGKDINQLRVAYVLETLERRGQDDIAFADNEHTRNMQDHMAKLRRAMMESQGNILLKDL